MGGKNGVCGILHNIRDQLLTISGFTETQKQGKIS